MDLSKRELAIIAAALQFVLDGTGKSPNPTTGEIALLLQKVKLEGKK